MMARTVVAVLNPSSSIGCYARVALGIFLGICGIISLLSDEPFIITTTSNTIDNTITTTRNNVTTTDIYCRGPILHTIQMALKEEDDCKDFVDRPMKYEPYQVLKAFEALPNHSKETLEGFLNDNFLPPGSDLLPAQPTDYQPYPPTLMRTMQHNETLRDWALQLNQLWKKLGRQPASSQSSQHSSLLPTKHTLIVPGGRFRESYYWDTYWIVHGLLVCDMYDTARGVVENLLDWANRYGFVPNGGRIYYLTRSQPPLLSEMVRLLHRHKKDMVFLKHAASALDKEYEFWMKQGDNGHAIRIESSSTGHFFVLNRYTSSSGEPRPESYREDTETAHKFSAETNTTSRQNVYKNLIAGAESGWDFSSRWLSDPQDLSTIQTSNIIPVDLNCILHRMEQNLAKFHDELGGSNNLNNNATTNKRQFYEQAADARRDAMNALLWDEINATWRDYVYDKQTFSGVVSASNYFPLWSRSYDHTNQSLVKGILSSFQSSQLLQPGGILTTTVNNTGQQWDQPNAWAPIQDILIDGFLATNTTEGNRLAETLTQRWVESNYIAWKNSGHMYEKYNALKLGGAGGGGEYNIQLGFGWTNGVILKLLSSHSQLFAS